MRAYITSILFIIAAFFLLCFAVAAYILFYWSYIPRIGFTRDIYLQYDMVPVECRTYLSQSSLQPRQVWEAVGSQQMQQTSQYTALAASCAGTPAPWGATTISPDAVSQQAYDIVIELIMPSTPVNNEAGNFMIDARLLSSTPSSIESYTNPFPSSQAHGSTSGHPDGNIVLAHARRPTMLPYRHPLVRLASVLFSLPTQVLLGFTPSSSSTALRQEIFTRVSFPRGPRSKPTTFHVQIQNPLGAQLQVARAKLHVRARFTGLRYLMYNFRLASAGVFVAVFFAAECVAALVIYAVLSLFVFGSSQPDRASRKTGGDGEQDQAKIKSEEDDDADDTDAQLDLSDTERTFPTYGRQQPLRYTNPVKTEPGTPSASGSSSAASGVVIGSVSTAMTPGPGGEADHEDNDEDDEDADFVLDNDTERWRDSGLGTSMDSGRDGRSGSVRRRRSRGQSGGSIGRR